VLVLIAMAEPSPARLASTSGGNDDYGLISAMHRVAVLALEPVEAFDLATPVQVLSPDRPGDDARYKVTVCGCRRGPVKTTHGYAVHATAGLGALRSADTVIIPGFDVGSRPVEAAALRAVRAAHRRGARIASICTGAFALAETGLLDGRSAATHWAYVEEFSRSFPRVEVSPDVLWVDHGDVLTSAGVAAGIDLSLHMVRIDHGAAVANAKARRMVVAPLRDGGQAQFIEAPAGSDPPTGDLAATRAWALEHLHQPIAIAQLAAHAGWSERSLLRRFRSETGTTPLRWLLVQRVRRAQDLLETSDLPIEVVATRCGFGSAPALRRHFERVVHTTPTAYRRTFRGK
jgi:transcriptional regulator GlxA family with amidase domain